VPSAELAARVHAIAELADIVRAMRTLASARKRQAQERFAGLERYAAATRAALREAMALGEAHPASSEPAGPRRVVVLFSEHGFVGALNERLLDRALLLVRPGGGELVAVGGRGRRLCRERKIAATDGGAMPTTVGGADAAAERLTSQLFGAVAEGRVGRIDVVFAEHHPPTAWDPAVARVFPPDLGAAPRATEVAPPLHTLPAEELVARAIAEYVFAQIRFVVGEAFASEQSARFVAMETSRRHIEDRLADLSGLERKLRQEAITNELLEIASGASEWTR
jgi:F-type H+-transporting ATPase subunit gamma